MPRFEPDQLVLVRGSEHTNWDLAHYSYCVVKEGKATFHHLQGWTLLFRDDKIIPYSGNEHLLGTTDSPTPKWVPKPGELVAVRDSENEEWKARVFLRRDSDNGIFECGSEIGLAIRTRWKLCEPIRKHFTIPEE